jgi:hypothetical protein
MLLQRLEEHQLLGVVNMTDEIKKIFSLNLIAYLMSRGHLPIDKGRCAETGNVYYVFKQDDKAIGRAIRSYKNDKKLHGFLEQFKYVKQEVRQVQ